MWKLEEWTENDYGKLVRSLVEQQDIEYKNFNKKLIPEVENIIGIRIPVLRKMAKEIAKGNYESYFVYAEPKEAKTAFYEEIMIQGMVIGYMSEKKTEDFEIIRIHMDQFVAKMNNWAVCDIFCSGMKVVGKHREEFYDSIMKYISTQETYKVRVGIVMLIDYYLNEEDVDKVLAICDEIDTEEYYINMAVAWLISEAFVKFEEKTLCFLKKNHLNQFTYNKALQKIKESLRVSTEKKAMIHQMKIKQT